MLELEYPEQIRSVWWLLNSLTHGTFGWSFRQVIFKLIVVIDCWGVSTKIGIRWIQLDLTDDRSTLVQVMAWCCQATSHYLSQCWPSPISPYGLTRPQWVYDILTSCFTKSSAVIVLITQDKQAFIFHEEEFKLPVPSQLREMIQHMNMRHVCILSTVATDALVLKHQAVSVDRADQKSEINSAWQGVLCPVLQQRSEALTIISANGSAAFNENYAPIGCAPFGLNSCRISNTGPCIAAQYLSVLSHLCPWRYEPSTWTGFIALSSHQLELNDKSESDSSCFLENFSISCGVLQSTWKS